MKHAHRCHACGQLIGRDGSHDCPGGSVDFRQMVEDIARWHAGSAYPRDRAMAARLANQRSAA